MALLLSLVNAGGVQEEGKSNDGTYIRTLFTKVGLVIIDPIYYVHEIGNGGYMPAILVLIIIERVKNGCIINGW